MSNSESRTDDPIPAETYHRAQAGERDAIEMLVQHHQRQVRAWVAAHCPVGCDADDIAQRTFLAAITRLGDFQVGTCFLAWLLTIARYQLMTESTRLRRLADYHSRHAPGLLAREMERRMHQPDDGLSDRLVYLKDCLSSLGESPRQFLHWRYDEELPLEEIASRAGRTIPAIKKQLWLLRQKLQQCIEAKVSAAQGGTA